MIVGKYFKKIVSLLGLFLVMPLFLFSCGTAPIKNPTPKIYSDAVSTMNQGIKWYDRGCYEKAIQLFWDAHEQFSAADLPSGVAASLESIGNASRHLGRIDDAILFLNESLYINKQLDQPEREIKTLADIAAAYLAAENIASAQASIEKAETLSKKWGGKGIHLPLSKGILLVRKKEFDNARSVLIATFKNIEPDDWAGKGTVNAALGHLELEAGNVEAAAGYFEAALEADRYTEYYRGVADNLAELAKIYAQKNDSQKSLFYLQRSIKVYSLLNAEDRVEQLLAQLTPLAGTLGQDVRLTETIVNRWLQGEVHHFLCE